MKQATVLGVADSHDAGVALVRGGRLVAAINEERLTREKQISGLPGQSLKRICEISGIAADEIDLVALAGKTWLGHPPPHNDFSRADGTFAKSQMLVELADRIPGLRGSMRHPLAASCYRGVMPKFARRRTRRLAGLLDDAGIGAPVVAYDHHDAHLASAYYTSGWQDALVISNDGFGDGLCCKVAVGRDGRLTTLSDNSVFNSLGNYYNLVTHICGFRMTHHVGKAASLAAHGDPERTIALFRRLIRWDPGRGRYVNDGPVFRQALDLIRREVDGIPRADIAAGMQRRLEEILAEMVTHYLAASNQSRVALVGGVHANVRANQIIAELPGIEEIYVFPHMGDGGLAAGAAFLGAAERSGGRADPARLTDLYLGPEFTEAEAEGALRQAGIGFERPTDMADAVAGHLAAGKVVGRFAGAMEYGPRALGNRSILYSATDPAVNVWLNERLDRTEFMPFAPVLRDGDAPRFLRNYSEATAHAAQFMTLTFEVTDLCRSEAPAVVHVDGTARPQVLRREANRDYYDILSAYHRLTGLSVLVNTSFNLHEEPIVCRPEEAVRAFIEAKLDVLAIGPFLAVNPSSVGGTRDRAAKA